ncbi:MAG: M23 family metallopeptidase, partial [Muribaculaceae bacterium]|nr:M23 family metallopeptidase [Muribaculaceae bacterium]
FKAEDCIRAVERSRGLGDVYNRQKIEEALAEETRRIKEEEERQRAEAARIEAEKREAENREAEKRDAEKKKESDSSESISSESKKPDNKTAASSSLSAKEGSGSQSVGNTSSSTSPVAGKSVPMTQEEQKRLTAQFEAAKGKLSAPYKGSGKIVKKFGRQKHPRLSNVTTENAGIDIETSRGADVLAVFDGEISKIFKLGGYNNVIVIRHGDYMTVYANLVDLKVAKGDKVKRGTELGKVYVDTSDNNRSVLHFELRHEKDKEDPELWLKKL